MEAADYILEAGWIVPVEPHGAVWPRHSLVISDGRIRAALPREEAQRRYRPETLVNLRHHALLPGLVNAHTHAAMSLLRGYAPDTELQTWLERYIWPAERRHVDATFVADGARLAIAEMLRGGTTCFNDMYYHPTATMEAAVAAGVRCMAGIRVLPMTLAWGPEPESCLEGGLGLLDRCRGQTLLRTSLAPHAPEALNGHLMRQLGILSREHRLPVHLHLHETAGETRAYARRTGLRPLQRLARQGLVNRRLIAVHMTDLTPAEQALVAESGASVVHCPRSNLMLASGFCPVAELLTRGVNVALGTDGAASSGSLDMLAEMRTAALLAKGVAGDSTALPAATALRMATLNGAKALGLETETGSLTPGKFADCIAIALDGTAGDGAAQVLSQLVYSDCAGQVTDVWVAGQRLLADRRLTTLDTEAVLARADDWAARIGAGERP